MFSSGGKKEHNYLFFFCISIHSTLLKWGSKTLRLIHSINRPNQNNNLNSLLKNSKTARMQNRNTTRKIPLLRMQEEKKAKKTPEYSPSQKCEPSTHLHRFPLLHNNKSRGIVFGTFNRLRLYLLGNRELTFTSSKKINWLAITAVRLENSHPKVSNRWNFPNQTISQVPNHFTKKKSKTTFQQYEAIDPTQSPLPQHPF